MSRVKFAGIVLVLLALDFAVAMTTSYRSLPVRLATHFAADGHPNGWMTRSGYAGFLLLIGGVMPACIAGLFYLLRFFPASAFNLPHRDYWLSPEHRAATFQELLASGLAIACLCEGFAIGVHLLTLDANSCTPVHLSNGGTLALTASFLAGIGWIVIRLWMRFNRKGDAR